MLVKAASCHCIIIQIYLYRTPCHFMYSAFSSINNPEQGFGKKKKASKNRYINSKNCKDLERQMLTEGKRMSFPSLAITHFKVISKSIFKGFLNMFNLGLDHSR